MSLGHSVIDLTNEVQDDIVILNDDIENLSMPTYCETRKITRKKKSPNSTILILDSPPPQIKKLNIQNDEIQIDKLIEVSNSKPEVPGLECPICLEKHRENLSVTICGHVFCKPCLKESLKTAKVCPKCRRKLTVKNFHDIFI